MNKVSVAKRGLGNVGQIRKILLVAVDDVNEIYEPARYVQLGEKVTVSFKPEATVVDLNILAGDGSYMLERIENMGYKLDASCRWHGSEANAELERMVQSKVIAITLDNDGTAEILGTKRLPLRVSYTYNADERVNEVSLVGIMKARMYAAGISDEQLSGTNVAFSVGFSFGFK